MTLLRRDYPSYLFNAESSNRPQESLYDYISSVRVGRGPNYVLQNFHCWVWLRIWNWGGICHSLSHISLVCPKVSLTLEILSSNLLFLTYILDHLGCGCRGGPQIFSTSRVTVWRVGNRKKITFLWIHRSLPQIMFKMVRECVGKTGERDFHWESRKIEIMCRGNSLRNRWTREGKCKDGLGKWPLSWPH